MTYDYRLKKTVIVLASTLAPGVAANVIGHLALALGHAFDPNDMGKNPLVDGAGVEHRGISKYPVIITKVKPGKLRAMLEQARLEPGLLIVDYPEEMLHTGHDDELEKALLGRPEPELVYLGVAMHGDYPTIDHLTGRFTLWGKD